MSEIVYTIGYGGISAERLFKLIDALGGVLVDIRYAARSRIPEWNKGRLEALFAGNYVHLQSLGNSAYKEGGMVIAHYPNGKASIEVLMQTLGKPVILMCACRDASECHRTVVGGMLAGDGFDVQELTGERITEILSAHTGPALQLRPPASTLAKRGGEDDAQLSLF